MTIAMRRLLGAALCLLATTAAAAPAAAPELFSRHPELYEVRLSPSGEHLALAVPADGGRETRLEILRLDGSGQTQALRFPQKQHVANITWVSDDQLVVSRARNFPFRPRPVSTGELITTDIRGKNQDMLFGYVLDGMTSRGRRKDEGFASAAMVLDGEPGKLLVEFACWNCGDEPDTAVFKVDSATGERVEVERSDGPADFVFDRSGRARIRISADADDNPVLAYRPTATADWTPVPASIAGRAIHWARFGKDPDIAYAEISDRDEVPRLYRVDLARGTRTELLAHPDLETDDILIAGRGGEPFGALYVSGKPAVRYFDPGSDWAKLHAGLMKAFPGEMVRFIDVSRGGERVLFFVSSDRHPGAYYLYDRRESGVKLIGETMPWIQPEAMASSIPVEFTSRDGRRIFGFYTATGVEPRPLVLMPHGGPFGVSDTWSYDADAQFLASRGYGVLQVNYRGSGQRGEGFERAGWTHWGDLLVNDLVDGVRWAVSQKLADPTRICAYGASYGGYSSMMATIAAPDLFRCAVGYAGVYDLPLFQKTSDTARNDVTRRYIARTMGTDPAMLRRFSPAMRASELKAPVFLVHGKDDRRAAFDQYEAMLAALRATGASPETYVVDGEGHGFYSPESQAELYRRLDAFLARSLNSAGAAAPSR